MVLNSLNQRFRFMHWLATMGSETIGLRVRATIDLVCLVSLFEMIVWVWKPAHSAMALVGGGIAFAAICIVVMSRVNMSTGVPPKGSRAWSLACAITFVCITILLGTAWTLDVIQAQWAFPTMCGKPTCSWWKWIGAKAGTVIFQQILLQLILYPLAVQITRRRGPALVLTALIFSGLHMPNPLAMVLTVAAAPVWCLVFINGGGRLLPVIASHLILILLANLAIPRDIHLGFAIGPRAIPRLHMLEFIYEHNAFQRLNELGSYAFYQRVGGTDALFVEELYRRLECRAPSPSESASLRKLLKVKTRREVALMVLTRTPHPQTQQSSHRTNSAD
jgi:hypothetical protein